MQLECWGSKIDVDIMEQVNQANMCREAKIEKQMKTQNENDDDEECNAPNDTINSKLEEDNTPTLKEHRLKAME